MTRQRAVVLDPTDGDDDRPAYDPAAYSRGGRASATPAPGPVSDRQTAPQTGPETGLDRETDSQTDQETPRRQRETKAETAAAAQTAEETNRRARRRRARAGYAMVGMIIMSAAASAVGWPVVLAAAGIVAGAGGAVAGVARAADPERRRDRTNRGGRPAGRRPGRPAASGGAGTGRLRQAARPAAGGTGRRTAAGGRAPTTGTGRRGGGLPKLFTGGRRPTTGGTPAAAGRRRTTTGAASSGTTTGRRTGGGLGLQRLFGGRPTTTRTAHTGGAGARTPTSRRSTAPTTARRAKREAIRAGRIRRARTAADRRTRMREARRDRRWARTDRRRQHRWDRRQRRREALTAWRDRRRAARQARRDERTATAGHRQKARRRFVKRYLRRPARQASKTTHRAWKTLRRRPWLAWVGERAPVMAHLAAAAPTSRRPNVWLRITATVRRVSTVLVLVTLGAALQRVRGRPPAGPVRPAPQTAAAWIAETEAALAVEREAALEAAAHGQPPRRPRPYPARAAVAPPAGARPRPTPQPAPAGPAGPRTRQAITPPRGLPRTMSTGGAASGNLHPAVEAVLEVLQEQIGGWTIPDGGDGEGVRDTDLFISSIGGLLDGVADVLDQQAQYMGGGETPIAPIVGDALADFAASTRTMAQVADEVHEVWTSNDQNAHDLARANGDIPQAELFNV